MSLDAPKFSSELVKRYWPGKDKDEKPCIKESPCWYGRRKDPGRSWKWIKLFTDKRASQRKWEDMRREAEARASGMMSADVSKLSEPIAKLKQDHIEALRQAGGNSEHHRIVEWMMDRLIELGDWKLWQDITEDSLREILTALENEGATASYRNKFIARAKAFVTHYLPDGWGHPLRKVKRIREKGARKTRERRAGTDREIGALYGVEMPLHRRLAYALAFLNGLRRNEAARLEWDDLKLDAPIPFVSVRPKHARSEDDRDYVPLHPVVVTLLEQWHGQMPGPRVLPSVPDLKTIVRDLDRAEVSFRDAKGRRLDYHALRHTFQTNLDRMGCSRATKKKLMRHAAQDVTDGYAHAELEEMAAALNRLSASSACPVVRDDTVNNSGSPSPTWVLGRDFGTIERFSERVNSVGAGWCQIVTQTDLAPGEIQQKYQRVFVPISAEPRSRMVPPCPYCVQYGRNRWYRFRGRLIHRYPRPVNSRRSIETQREVRELLAKGAANV